MSSAELLSWLLGSLGPRPHASLGGNDTDERDAILKLGLSRFASAAATLVGLLNEHPDQSVRSRAADALLCYDDRRLLEALASMLDFERWDGGPVTRQAVAAVFKLDPTRAGERLRPAFDRAIANPHEVQVIALTALQYLFEDFLSRSPIQQEWRATRNMPDRLFDEDRERWTELCYRLSSCNHNTNQRIPLSILRMTGDDRWLEAVFLGLSNNRIADICMVLREADDPAAAPRLRSLARKTKGADRKLLVALARDLERPRAQ